MLAVSINEYLESMLLTFKSNVTKHRLGESQLSVASGFYLVVRRCHTITVDRKRTPGNNVVSSLNSREFGESN